MAEETAKLYTLPSQILSVGGQIIQGSSTDEFLAYDEAQAAAEGQTGAHGNHVASIGFDETFGVTITLLQSSYFVRVLHELFRAQRQAFKDGLESGFLVFNHEDQIGGTVMNSDRAYFTNYAAPGFARVAGTVEFTMNLPGAAGSYVLEANRTF